METAIKAFMSGDPISVGPEASALEAFERMLERGIRHLPVVDGAGHVVGVLSLEDLRSALPFPVSLRRDLEPGEREAAREWRVGEIMTHAPELLGPDAPLSEAAERMAEYRIGCLPVVDEDGYLAGMLSETDVLWALANHLGLRSALERRGPRAQLEALIAELERERERLRARLSKRQREEARIEATDREEPLDEAERGADWSEIRSSRSLDELAHRRLVALDHALDRAAQGELGVCERCGGAIPVPRLRALPGTTLCVACAREAR